MSAVPGPSSPLYYEADFGPYHWPPKPGTGRVLIKVKTALEVETQKPNGKDPVKSKVKGKKPATVTADFQWTREVEDEGNAIRLAMDPNGPNSGVALDVRNPEPNGRGVDHVLWEEASELTINGDMYSFSLSGKGWKEPQKAAVGGTTTPNKAVPASAKIVVGQGGDLPGGTVPLGEFEDPLGLKGPNAPNAEP
jgi:hypothetical protein